LGFGEHFGSLMGTIWELDANTLGTQKIQKTIPLLPKPKRKKIKLPSTFLLPP